MKRSKRLTLPLLAILLLAPLPLLAQPGGPEDPAGPAIRTVSVDCDKGQSINKALRKPADELIVEISGFCNERVEFSRDKVTLIGSDPATDGITGPALDDVLVQRALVRIKDSRGVRLENLTITASESRGIEGTNSAFLEVVNCRIENNDGRGLQLGVSSFARVEDTVIADNGGIELITFSGGDIRCTGCTVSDDDGIVVAPILGSQIVLTDSTVSSGGLAVVSFASNAFATNTDVTGSPIALYATNGAEIEWDGGDVDGSVWGDRSSGVYLFGINQTSNPATNQFNEHSHLRVIGGTLASTTSFSGFANGTFESGVTLDVLGCSGGGEAFCDGSETKTASSCGLCP